MYFDLRFFGGLLSIRELAVKADVVASAAVGMILGEALCEHSTQKYRVTWRLGGGIGRGKSRDEGVCRSTTALVLSEEHLSHFGFRTPTNMHFGAST